MLGSALVDVVVEEGVLAADAVARSGVVRQVGFVAILVDLHVSAQVGRLVFEFFQATCGPEVHAQVAETLSLQLCFWVAVLDLFGLEQGDFLFGTGLDLFLGDDT